MRIAILCCLVISVNFTVTAQTIGQYLQQQLEPLVIGEGRFINNQPVHASELVIAAYSANRFEPIWADLVYAAKALELIGESGAEGLSPQDYHYDTISRFLNDIRQSPDEALQAQFDILLTDAVMTYATHLIRGKVNPQSLTPTWNYELFNVSPSGAAAALLRHVKEQTLHQGLSDLSPKLPQYQGLKDALKFYSRLAESGVQEQVQLSETVLRPGESGPAVPALRRQLANLGYFEGQSDLVGALYDDELVSSVRQLQSHHGLSADGIIGRQTLEVLNRPYHQVVDQIRVNLERIRWVDNSLSERFLVVNIAGFELFLYQEGTLQWKTRVIVGRDYTKTPVFKEKLRYIVVNPTWTVPRSIGGGIIEKQKRDPDYLSQKDFIVVDNRRNPVDPASINWASMNRQNFPYWFVQTPSENNALGQIKFMFPNKYAIYLHDTPAKSLFDSETRTFSHGCVRVEKPFELAEYILSQNAEWQTGDIASIVETRQTEKIFLDQPLDIFLMYWTAMATRDGLHFYPDVYGRDAALLKQLQQPMTGHENNT
ncbi:murein L,D-transpeptidase [Alteromonas aestuariivivens]|uniref:Murein L,D-transpeptidase n=1 Tax=Alteromonas aestuariivivens TaxID=1938339 RepID=A0A3D8M3I6_9ALTE|nr:L,D-transpeptidase family protein [Alteromonas aestuariivivens]RDV24094.1 murein L,D-transpeptidase [Alteromonas aestuariivivens]